MDDNKFKSLTCKICGENLILESIQEDGCELYKCDFCNAKYKIENKSKSQEFRKNEIRHNAIVELRKKGEFAEIISMCNDIIKENDKLSYPYIERLYAKYGIQFPAKDEYKATFYDMPVSIDQEEKYDFTQEDDYKKAYLYGNDSEKAIYEKIAKDINESISIYQDIYKKTDDYDVFISYKRTTGEVDEYGKEILTDDVNELNELRNNLISKYGLKVFMAPYSIKNSIRYEPQIFSALIKAKTMILYGSNPSYFSSQWVRNEWKRFIDRTNTDLFKSNQFGYKLNGSLIVVTNGVNPKDLPRELKQIQIISTREISSDINVIETLSSILNEYNLYQNIENRGLTSYDVKEIDVTELSAFKTNQILTRKIGIDNHNQINQSLNAILNKAMSQLKIKRFDEARKLYQDILRDNPNMISAIKGEFFALHRVVSFDELMNENLFNNIDDILSILEKIESHEAEEILTKIGNYIIANSSNLSNRVKTKLFESICKYEFEGKNNFLNEYDKKAAKDLNMEMIIESIKYHNFKSKNDVILYLKGLVKITDIEAIDSEKTSFFVSRYYHLLATYAPDNIDFVKKCIDLQFKDYTEFSDSNSVLLSLKKICNLDEDKIDPNYVVNYIRCSHNPSKNDMVITYLIDNLRKKKQLYKIAVANYVLDSILPLYQEKVDVKSIIYDIASGLRLFDKQNEETALFIVKVASLFDSTKKEDVKKIIDLSCFGLCHLYNIRPVNFDSISSINENEMFDSFSSYDFSEKYLSTQESLISLGESFLAFPDLLDIESLNKKCLFISNFKENFENVKIKKKVEKKVVVGKNANKVNNVVSASRNVAPRPSAVSKNKKTSVDKVNKKSKFDLLKDRTSQFVIMCLFFALTIFYSLCNVAQISSLNSLLVIFMGVVLVISSLFSHSMTVSRNHIINSVTNKYDMFYYVEYIIFINVAVNSNVSGLIPFIFSICALGIKFLQKKHIKYISIECLVLLASVVILDSISMLFFDGGVLNTVISLSYLVPLGISVYHHIIKKTKGSICDEEVFLSFFIGEIISGLIILGNYPILNFVDFDIMYFIRFEFVSIGLYICYCSSLKDEVIDNYYIGTEMLLNARHYLYLVFSFICLSNGNLDFIRNQEFVLIFNQDKSFILVVIYILMLPILKLYIKKLMYVKLDIKNHPFIPNKFYKIVSSISSFITLGLYVAIVYRAIMLFTSSSLIVSTFDRGLIIMTQKETLSNVILPICLLVYVVFSWVTKRKRMIRR